MQISWILKEVKLNNFVDNSTIFFFFLLSFWTIKPSFYLFYSERKNWNSSHSELKLPKEVGSRGYYSADVVNKFLVSSSSSPTQLIFLLNETGKKTVPYRSLFSSFWKQLISTPPFIRFTGGSWSSGETCPFSWHLPEGSRQFLFIYFFPLLLVSIFFSLDNRILSRPVEIIVTNKDEGESRNNCKMGSNRDISCQCLQ